ncbi:hypothetical protein LLEC1_03165 [Akanthomyces lecanii]|uniref:Amino-acid N-acetyltransferase subunit Mak10 n=1 Tax=Cordyceps confragosa TaxID=2714763 RepID=A0A179I6B6_CORDF|nr:hypothetical protein LLEC1_03165 [Akanthomyces lecanii]
MTDYAVDPEEIARLSLAQDSEQFPPPAIHSPGVVPIDITAKFAEAVKTLEPGELVKDGFFTLFESVSALEIGDPKMDSGCVAPGEKFEEEYDVSRRLLPEEVLGIIDELICHEISWHLGYPLSQTIFTSVYVEALSMPDPANIGEAQFVRSSSSESRAEPMLQILRAYCLGMLKGCSYVNERIQMEHYYEEEDFVINTYNRTLLRRISTRNIQSALSEAQGLITLLKDDVSEEILQALSARLTLRRVFLEAAESPENKQDFAKAQAPWVEAADYLPIIEKTHALAKDVDEAFSAKLQRKLASTMPPRPIVQLDFTEAFAHLSRMFEDGREVINVLKYTDSQCLLTFVSTFQAKKPQPLVYVRTLLQTLLFDEMQILGHMSIRQLLDDDLSIFTLPASPLLARSNDDIEAVHDIRFTMSQQTELFRQRAAQPFLDILRTFCQNRCRIRRTLCHLIRDWEDLQMDAEDIDHVLQVKTKEQPLVHRASMLSSSARPVESYALSLSSWAYLYKLRLMEAIVQLGFELEVYQPDEHLGMYWYLNYLAKGRLQHAERIKSFVVHRVDELSAEESFSVGSHGRWVADVKNGLKSCIAAGIAITTLQKALAGVDEQKAGEEPLQGKALGLKVEVPTPDKSYHPFWIVPRVTAIPS